MTKQLHTAKASMNGTMAALLAQKSFTGPKKILEGNRGFFNAMSEEHDVSRIIENLGQEFKILENSFKVHASCRHTHHAIDLLIDIFKEHQPVLEEIESVEVNSYQVALTITDDADPQTEYAAKFSLQFCSALALLNGRASLEDFGEEELWDKDIRALMEKVNVHVDPAIDESYPRKWGATVTVLLKNGEKIYKQTDFPKGDPENAVTTKELLEKFIGMATIIPLQQRQALAESLMNLESIENISDLMKTL
ncbi:MmgE/PrpD family protein [Planococcus faecalis]